MVSLIRDLREHDTRKLQITSLNMHIFPISSLALRSRFWTKTAADEIQMKRIYRSRSQRKAMAKMVSCPCGWTLISPQGDEDVKKHTMIHVQDAHPGMTMTQDDLTKMIKSV